MVYTYLCTKPGCGHEWQSTSSASVCNWCKSAGKVLTADKPFPIRDIMERMEKKKKQN